MDAVGTIGGAWHDAIEKYNLVPPFLHLYCGVGGAGESVGKCGQFMIVSGEQDAAAIYLMQIFEGRPSDGETIEGGSASADFVEDNERALACLIEDRSGLHHLDHERGAPAGEIIGSADAAEQSIDNTDMRRLRRHERAQLSKHHDQRILAKEG